MDNPYYVQNLSGLDVGAQIQDVIDRRKSNIKQDKMAKLAHRAASGDQSAISEMYAQDPRMGDIYQKRQDELVKKHGIKKSADIKKAEVEFGLKWIGSTPEQKKSLLSEAINNPLIDLGQEDLAISGKSADLAVNHMLYGHLGKDQYSRIIPKKTGVDARTSGFQYLTDIVKADPEGKTTAGKAAAINLGLRSAAPKLFSSLKPVDIGGVKYMHNKDGSISEITVNGKVLNALSIAESKRVIAKGKQTGKLQADFSLLPKTRSAVKEAEVIAKQKGETFNKISELKSQLPTIRKTVSDLNKLAGIATYTKGGQAFDFMTKELGFGATKGATARAKYTAIVANQILPLLRQTFGAQFTENEGKRLLAVLGDINATPEAKKSELDAFITLKERNLEGLKNKLSIDNNKGIPIDPALLNEPIVPIDNKGVNTDTNTLDLSKMSPEQLNSLREKIIAEGKQ